MNENPSFIIIAKRNYENEYDYEEVVGNTVVTLTKNDYNVSVETDKEIDCTIIKYWEYTYTPVSDKVSVVTV